MLVSLDLIRRVRRKRIIKNLNVYAVGFYLDAEGAKQLCKSSGARADDATLAGVSKAHDVEKTLRMVINFKGVNKNNFWSALEERLKPSLDKAGQPELVEQFGHMFDGVQFRKGLTMTFTSGKGGDLITAVDDKEVGRIHSPVLAEALFDIYLGTNPVSPDAKESISRGIAQLAQLA
eukprot:jgi/Astpho2/5611/Aster-02863